MQALQHALPLPILRVSTMQEGTHVNATLVMWHQGQLVQILTSVQLHHHVAILSTHVQTLPADTHAPVIQMPVTYKLALASPRPARSLCFPPLMLSYLARLPPLAQRSPTPCAPEPTQPTLASVAMVTQLVLTENHALISTNVHHPLAVTVLPVLTAAADTPALARPILPPSTLVLLLQPANANCWLPLAVLH